MTVDQGLQDFMEDIILLAISYTVDRIPLHGELLPVLLDNVVEVLLSGGKFLTFWGYFVVSLEEMRQRVEGAEERVEQYQERLPLKDGLSRWQSRSAVAASVTTQLGYRFARSRV